MAREKQELLFMFGELSSEIWITCYHQSSCCDFKPYLSAECRGKQKLHVGQLRWILGRCELHPQGIVGKSVFASGNRFFEAQLSEF